MKIIIDSINFTEAVELWLLHKHGIVANVDAEGGGEWDYERHKMITWNDGKRTVTELDYPEFEVWVEPVTPDEVTVEKTEEVVENGETTDKESTVN